MFCVCVRMSSLRSLLQVQWECEASVCAVQSALQKRWALLEELHTRVTLSPDSTQKAHDPHAVLTDTEVTHVCAMYSLILTFCDECLLIYVYLFVSCVLQNLFAELSQFKSKVQQCRTQLETNINLLQVSTHIYI